MEARYAAGKSIFFFVGGLLALAVNAALLAVAGFWYPVVAMLGVMGMVVGLRGIDRRVKLRIGPEGFWYAPWGPQTIPWGEFDRYSTYAVGRAQFIELRPKFPEQLRTRLPLVSRINSAVNARFGRPSFYITPTQFDVTSDDLAGALARHLPRAS